MRIITIKTKCQLPKRLKASPYPAKPRRSKYTVNQITCQTIIVQTQEVLWISNLGLWILYYWKHLILQYFQSYLLSCNLPQQWLDIGFAHSLILPWCRNWQSWQSQLAKKARLKRGLMEKHAQAQKKCRLPLKTIYGVVRLLLSIYFAKTKHNQVQLWAHESYKKYKNDKNSHNRTRTIFLWHKIVWSSSPCLVRAADNVT